MRHAPARQRAGEARLVRARGAAAAGPLRFASPARGKGTPDGQRGAPPTRRPVKAELVYLDSSALVKLVVKNARATPCEPSRLCTGRRHLRACRDRGAAGGGTPLTPPRPLRPRAPRPGRRRAARAGSGHSGEGGGSRADGAPDAGRDPHRVGARSRQGPSRVRDVRRAPTRCRREGQAPLAQPGA